MQRYFAKDKYILEDSDIHHIKSVMRMRIGDKIEVVYDNKLYIGKITSLNPFNYEIIEGLKDSQNNSYSLTVAVSLVKEQKMDLILQKLTELGVSEIIPLKTERSIVKIDGDRFEKKKIRWESICKEASEQSKRLDIPKIRNIMSLKELILENADTKLVASTNKNNLLDYYLQDKEKCAKIIVVIGPEGGITEKEEKFLYDNGYNGVSFGNLIFRVETACIYIASIINYFGSKR